MDKGKWAELLAVPRDFLHGFLGGLFGPILALAATVGVVYVATGQLPALREVRGSDGTRYRAISLTSPLEARASWARYGGELHGAILEMKAKMQNRG
jgi:hypothetical protein